MNFPNSMRGPICDLHEVRRDYARLAQQLEDSQAEINRLNGQQSPMAEQLEKQAHDFRVAREKERVLGEELAKEEIADRFDQLNEKLDGVIVQKNEMEAAAKNERGRLIAKNNELVGILKARDREIYDLKEAIKDYEAREIAREEARERRRQAARARRAAESRENQEPPDDFGNALA